MPRAGLPRTPLAFDGTTAAFESDACDGSLQVTVVAIAKAPGAQALDGCPVRVAVRTVAFHPSGTGRVAFYCPHGCTGSLHLDIADPRVSARELNAYTDFGLGSPEPLLASGSVHLRPGDRPMTVRLRSSGRRARRLLLAHGRRLRAAVSVQGPGQLLGSRVLRATLARS